MKEEPAESIGSKEAATGIGLIYVNVTRAGITRHNRGKGFVYRDPQGRIIRDRETLRRIASLVIPPAWQSVWICPSERGHIQAIGRDARGRRQYRYHPKFRAVRDENKFARMAQFVKVLPRIRRRVGRDLRRRGLPREKVVATVVRLLETTLIRVGNEEYARTNKHYGLTTIRNRHASVRGSTVRFHFTGKSGVRREVEVTDPHVARIIRRCQELPGEELFEYVDETGATHAIGSGDVNEYLREISKADFTAKDFRTWAATVLAAQALAECESCTSQADTKGKIVQVIECVAKRLGNTRAVCRKCYIHPAILDSYTDGRLAKFLANRNAKNNGNSGGLPMDEAAVLELLAP